MLIIFKYISFKQYLSLWLYKSAIVDYSKQRQALFILATMFFIPENFILGILYCVFWWFIHDVYFWLWRKLYIVELAKANGLEVIDEIKCS